MNTTPIVKRTHGSPRTRGLEGTREQQSKVGNATEVISLVDEDSSTEEEQIKIGKVSFLDPDNLKTHRFIKILNAEDENTFVDVENVSSDSDIEEIEAIKSRTCNTTDPDDYKEVMKEKCGQEDLKIVIKDSPEEFKMIRNKNRTVYEGKKRKKIDSSRNSIVEGSLRTYTATEIQELEREMRDLADDCSSCALGLWQLPTLRAHALIHSTGQVDCESCHNSTPIIERLIDHLESHIGSEEVEDSDL